MTETLNQSSKKIYLIAGEASGDLHGSNLMKELVQLNPHYKFRFWGGDLMSNVGGELVSHYKDRSVMGVWEVLKNLKKFKAWIQQCKDDLEEYKPDLLVLIDYGGFNLRIAKHAYNLGIKVHYYIPPKVWAWNEKRVHKIRKFTHKVYVILPFEKKYFSKHGIDCDYVGNPIADEIEAAQTRLNSELEEPITEYIALLPGSRAQEIKYGLTTMLSYAKNNMQYSFKLAAVDSVHDLIKTYSYPDNVEIVLNKTYEVLSKAKAAVITSGTANLEAALLNTPQVVVYKGSLLTYILAQLFVKVRHFSPVNLIADKEVVKELIQARFNPRKLEMEMERIIRGPHRDLVLAAYKKIREEVGDPGCSAKVAIAIESELA
jgi:lipid-A-disaccharide synthase